MTFRCANANENTFFSPPRQRVTQRSHYFVTIKSPKLALVYRIKKKARKDLCKIDCTLEHISKNCMCFITNLIFRFGWDYPTTLTCFKLNVILFYSARIYNFLNLSFLNISFLAYRAGYLFGLQSRICVNILRRNCASLCIELYLYNSARCHTYLPGQAVRLSKNLIWVNVKILRLFLDFNIGFKETTIFASNSQVLAAG